MQGLPGSYADHQLLRYVQQYLLGFAIFSIFRRVDQERIAFIREIEELFQSALSEKDHIFLHLANQQDD